MADEDQNDQGNNDIKELRRKADEASAAKREADAAKRELAFVRAGIDTENGPGKLLFKSYDGELTKEAVEAAAAEYGITPASASSTSTQGETTPPPPQHDPAQSAERNALASGSGAPNTESAEHPGSLAMKDYQDARARGVPEEKAAAAAFSRIVAAANAGDKRVIIEG